MLVHCQVICDLKNHNLTYRWLITVVPNIHGYFLSESKDFWNKWLLSFEIHVTKFLPVKNNFIGIMPFPTKKVTDAQNNTKCRRPLHLDSATLLQCAQKRSGCWEPTYRGNHTTMHQTTRVLAAGIFCTLISRHLFLTVGTRLPTCLTLDRQNMKEMKKDRKRKKEWKKMRWKTDSERSMHTRIL
jgi:hypothetical protein